MSGVSNIRHIRALVIYLIIIKQVNINTILLSEKQNEKKIKYMAKYTLIFCQVCLNTRVWATDRYVVWT